jgi:hypothetical protein
LEHERGSGDSLSDLLNVTKKLQQERGRGAGKRKGSSSFRFAARNKKAAAGMRKVSRKEKGEQESRRRRRDEVVHERGKRASIFGFLHVKQELQHE